MGTSKPYFPNIENTWKEIQTFVKDIVHQGDVKLDALKKFWLDGGSIVNFSWVSPHIEVIIPDDLGNAGLSVKNSDGFIKLQNGTSTANKFNAVIRLFSSGGTTLKGFFISTIPVSEDTGTNPVLVLDSRQEDDTAIVSRDLLHIQNDGVKKIGFDKDGVMELVSLTANTALFVDSNKKIKSMGIGTDGQVFTSKGAGLPPLFENAAGAIVTKQSANNTSDQTTTSTSYVDVTSLTFTMPNTTQKAMINAIIHYFNSGAGHTAGFEILDNTTQRIEKDFFSDTGNSTAGQRITPLNAVVDCDGQVVKIRCKITATTLTIMGTTEKCYMNSLEMG